MLERDLPVRGAERGGGGEQSGALIGEAALFFGFRWWGGLVGRNQGDGIGGAHNTNPRLPPLALPCPNSSRPSYSAGPTASPDTQSLLSRSVRLCR